MPNSFLKHFPPSIYKKLEEMGIIDLKEVEMNLEFNNEKKRVTVKLIEQPSSISYADAAVLQITAVDDNQQVLEWRFSEKKFLLCEGDGIVLGREGFVPEKGLTELACSKVIDSLLDLLEKNISFPSNLSMSAP